MESPTRNGAPLLPTSPEKINRLPQSPSMPNLDPFMSSPSKPGSVQGKVAQFNNLSKEASQKRKDNEAALRRAVLGREEAESETARLREENAALKAKLEEARARDQRVAKKFEAYSEEKRNLIEHQHKVQKISEQEVRRARKEAFRYSSELVNAREDLQKARGHLEKLQDQANIERNRGKRFQQEAFDAKLALSDVEDELEAMKKQLQTAEAERDALRTNLNEEQVARVAAEGRIPLPPTSNEDDEFASPRKSKNRRVSRRVSSRRESLKENMDPAWRASNDIFDIMWAAEEGDEFAIAKRNLWVEEKRRQEAEMMIKYLKAEYERKPKACGCSKHRQSQVADTPVLNSPTFPDMQATDNDVLASTTEMVMDHPTNNEAADEPMEEVDAMEEDTIVHYDHPQVEKGLGAEEGEEEGLRKEQSLVSPLLGSESSPPAFLIHEDVEDVDNTPVHVQPAVPNTLAPVIPSTSPSLLDLDADADKENPRSISQTRLSFDARLSRSGLETADTSILSIKSEDVDDSENSNLCSALTPRAIPNQIVSPVPELESVQKLNIEIPEEASQRETAPDSAFEVRELSNFSLHAPFTASAPAPPMLDSPVSPVEAEPMFVREPEIFTQPELEQEPKSQSQSISTERPDLNVTPVYRSTTTTTSVPLKGTSPDNSSAKNYPFSPGATMTREQALEAIKQRRRRAKSITEAGGTAGRKRNGLGELLRRDVSSKSAPA